MSGEHRAGAGWKHPPVTSPADGPTDAIQHQKPESRPHPMNYYKFRNRFSRLKGGETYVEANRGYTMRQIVFLNGETIASNRYHPEYGFTLPAGYVDYAAYQDLNEKEIKAGLIDPMKTITEAEFEALWHQNLDHHRGDWDAAKARFPVGAEVSGPVATFYPHGVLLTIGEGVLGLADSRVCRASSTETIFPGRKVSGVVAGYDEINQWILVDAPRVEP